MAPAGQRLTIAPIKIFLIVFKRVSCLLATARLLPTTALT